MTAAYCNRRITVPAYNVHEKRFVETPGYEIHPGALPEGFRDMRFAVTRVLPGEIRGPWTVTHMETGCSVEVFAARRQTAAVMALQKLSFYGREKTDKAVEKAHLKIKRAMRSRARTV